MLPHNAFRILLALGLAAWISSAALAWDEKGHVLVTRLAVAALPPEFPAFATTPDAEDRLAYLSAEPDRWRGQRAYVLEHINGPDHYLDVEDLEAAGIPLFGLPRFRNEFIETLERMRIQHPERFPPLDGSKDRAHTQSVPGLLPYAIEELRWKVAASWTTLRTFEAFRDVAKPYELEAARNNVLQHMGLLSHFVGDAAQPLHLTRHHHGWVGENPENYSTCGEFHQYIDGGVIDLHGFDVQTLRPRVRPPTWFDPRDPWREIAAMLDRSFQRVEPLYRLDRDGRLRDAHGRIFIEECLHEGAANLAGLWVAAWKASGEDDYLAKKLAARRAAK